MTAFVRSIETWAHLAAWQVTDYSLPEYSESDEKGSLTVLGEQPDRTGHWLLLDGRVYIITKSAPSDGKTKLTAALPCHAFDRKLLYAGDGAEQYGTFIAAQLSAEYVSQTDAWYAMPYLTVSNSDTTAFSFPVEPGADYALSDIVRAAETALVRFTFTPSLAGLSLTIAPGAAAERRLFPGDGHTQLKSQAWSASIVEKVTVRTLSGDGETAAVTASADYYWHGEDGTVSTTPPAVRERGTWIRKDIKTGEDAAAAAAEAMKGNSKGYKIELWSDRADLRQGDSVLLRLGGEDRRAVISTSVLSSGDRRRLIKCGTMTTTLTEVLASANKEE